jgi:hypothetical protein
LLGNNPATFVNFPDKKLASPVKRERNSTDDATPWVHLPAKEQA